MHKQQVLLLGKNPNVVVAVCLVLDPLLLDLLRDLVPGGRVVMDAGLLDLTAGGPVLHAQLVPRKEGTVGDAHNGGLLDSGVIDEKRKSRGTGRGGRKINGEFEGRFGGLDRRRRTRWLAFFQTQ